MKKVILIGILAVLLIPASALALTYTFDGIAAGRYDELTFNSLLTPGGYVTFSGGTFVAQFGASSQTITPSISGMAILTYYTGTENVGETRATFTTPTDAVSIAFGDYGSASGDGLYLRAYNSSDTLVGEAGFSIPGDSMVSQTLTVSTANIAYVVFGSTGVYPNSVYWDNFTFNERPSDGGGAAVPEPATMLLLGTGLLGLVGISRRKLRS